MSNPSPDSITDSSGPTPTVGDLMTTDVISADPNVSVQLALRTMMEHGVTCLPVMSRDGRLAGMISRTDARTAVTESPGDEPRVRNAMTGYVYKAQPDMPVVEAAKLMLDQGISTLPVVDETGLLGIFTKTDILEWLVKDQAAKRKAESAG